MNSINQQLTRCDEARLRRWAPWFLAALTLLLLLPTNNLLPLLDRDEPRFAEATREMLVRNDWIVPYFNNEYRFDKPILIYWMMAGAYRGLGINEFAARLPAVLCAVLLVWLTFRMGARWFSTAIGVAAALGLLTCLQLLIHGRSAVADMPMIVCVLAAQWALFELLANTELEHEWSWFWLFYGAMGVGFLAKGPVALVVPLLTALLYRWVFWRRPMPWRRLRIGWGLPLVLVIIGSWGIPALVMTHGDFFKVGIEKHVLQRGFTSFEGHGSFAPYYYLVTALFSLFPWISFAGDAIPVVRRNWNSTNAFLVAWVVATYGLFTIYLTKLPHYVLPAFPALFLLWASSVHEGEGGGKWATVWFWFVHGLVAVVAGVAISVAMRFDYPENAAGLRMMILAFAGILLSLSVVCICWRYGSLRPIGAALAMVVVSLCCLGVGLRAVTPAVELTDVFRQSPPATECAAFRYIEPSLVFYSQRFWAPVKNEEEFDKFLAQPGPRLAVCQVRSVSLSDWLKSKPPAADVDWQAPGDYKQMDVAGLCIARGSWVMLRVYYRF